jgi:hypothetical protein
LSGHLREQSLLGRKFRFGAAAPAEGQADTYRLFYNELIYSQNIVYTRADAQEQVFLEHNVINFLETSDPGFCKETRATLETIQRKCTPISTVSERARNKYFNQLDQSIARMKSRAESLISSI